MPRWPTPPRSEASCGTTVSEQQHSGGGGGVLGSAGATGAEHSSRANGMEGSPAAVIAGGAPEGQQPLPDPLAAHPRYRKVRDLNWCAALLVQPLMKMHEDSSLQRLQSKSTRT